MFCTCFIVVYCIEYIGVEHLMLCYFKMFDADMKCKQLENKGKHLRSMIFQQTPSIGQIDWSYMYAHMYWFDHIQTVNIRPSLKKINTRQNMKFWDITEVKIYDVFPEIQFKCPMKVV